MNIQINHISQLAYQGKNQAELQGRKEKEKFESNEWLTFLQARQEGLMIKKGSKGISVFKGFGDFTKKDKDGKIKTSSGPLGFATVFNLDQTDINLNDKKFEVTELKE